MRVPRALGLPAVVPVLALVLTSCGDGQPTLFSSPASVLIEGTAELEGTVGFEAGPLPVFRVRDEQGNPVPGVIVRFRVEEGGGTVFPAEAMTDESGRARPEAWGRARPEAWILGPDVGLNVLVADIDGLPSQQVDAFGFPPFAIEAVQLNQGSQYRDGRIGGVADRRGLLRVIGTARVNNSHSPDVLIRLFQGESLIREEVVPTTRGFIPTSPNLNLMGDTWNLLLSPEEVVPGLRVEAIMDPDQALDLGPRVDLRYPREPGAVDLDVRTTANLDLVLVPVASTLYGVTGNVHAGNVGTFLEETRRWIPTPGIDHRIDDPFASDADIRTGSGWSQLLGEIRAKRTVEGAEYEYYHGIVPMILGIPFAGLAYVVQNPAGVGFRVGLTFDLLPQASATLAHELGHNMGRLHSPCGDPGGIDQDYPHPNNSLGSTGFDVLSGLLVHSGSRNDFMSYCSPRFTSDFTYEHVLARTRFDPVSMGGVAGSAPLQPSSAGLLLWGRVGSDGVVLNPAFQVEAPSSLPARGGPHELRGVAADGRELFRFSFEGGQLDHSPDPLERHFAFVVPHSAQEAEALERIELRSPRGQATHRAAPARLPHAPRDDLRDPEIVVDRGTAGRVRLRWEGERFPMVMLRDPETGRVLGFARQGEGEFPDPDRRLERAEVLLSDGVRSRPAIRR